MRQLVGKHKEEQLGFEGRIKRNLMAIIGEFYIISQLRMSVSGNVYMNTIAPKPLFKVRERVFW